MATGDDEKHVREFLKDGSDIESLNLSEFIRLSLLESDHTNSSDSIASNEEADMGLKSQPNDNTSTCLTLSDIDDASDWDSSGESGLGDRRSRPDTDEPDHTGPQDLDDDYRLAVELDRAINGGWDRIEQLLFGLEDESQVVEEPEPLYPVGEALFAKCEICFDDKFLHKRTCCQYPVCDECLTTYFEIHVSHANVKISCPNCESYVYRTEVYDKISPEMSKKYHQFIVDANKDPLQKTCPRCSGVHSIEEWQLKDKIVKKYGLKVECKECQIEWCFQCQAPLHEGMKCKVYQKGEKLVKEWASQLSGDQANARRCPKCQVWIQRSSGCDHMICNQCNAQFCYRCGGRYISLKFLGSHHSKWSIFGCKNNFLPNRPVARRLARGSIFAGQVVGGVVLGGLAVAAVGALAGVAVIGAPIYGGVRLHKKIKRQREAKRRAEEVRESQQRWEKRVQDLRLAGDPYLEQWQREAGPSAGVFLYRNSFTENLKSQSDISPRAPTSCKYDPAIPVLETDFPADCHAECDSDADSDAERSRPSVHTSMAEIHSKL